MIESNMNNWMAIPLHYLRHVGGTLVFECDYAISMVEISGLPPFCYEVLVAWSQVQTLNSAIHPIKVELAVGFNFGLLSVHLTLISVSKSKNRHYLFTFPDNP